MKVPSVKLLTLEKKDVSEEQLIKLIRAEWTKARKTESYQRSFKNILAA
jgi:hypothetical protein